MAVESRLWICRFGKSFGDTRRKANNLFFIKVIDEVGPAHFVDKTTLEIDDGRRFSADRIILTVGGEPRKRSIPGNEMALSFHDLWGLRELPGRVTIVGGSATGCQLAPQISSPTILTGCRNRSMGCILVPSGRAHG